MLTQNQTLGLRLFVITCIICFQLNQLKSDLRDVLYSHKWTPDAYLLAKAYIAEDDAREAAVHDRLPKIALKQPSRKL